MAEGVVTQIAGKLLEVLGSQVFQEIESVFGVKDEIKKLKDTVETVKAVLVDAEEKHSKRNEQVTVFLRRLNDVFYDADDLLDDLATQLKERELMSGNKITKEVRIFFSKSNQIACSLKMVHKIKAVRETLNNIKKDREFHLLDIRDEKQVNNLGREQTHSFVRGEMVIGRDDDKNEIIKLLLETSEDEKISVIPIVGMGGLGKTTLAQLVYNDEQVEKHFQLKMWVCVSEQFDVEMIVGKILKSATNEEPGNLELDQLQIKLRGKIVNEKYLLVLDDIWNEDCVKWNKLKDLLINDVRGSKILVTTRSQKVADITNKRSSYVLKGLDEDNSWSLFKQKAFDHGEEPKDSKRLVEIGKEIVAKCGGVPLAICTIGSSLNSKITEEDWSSVRDHEMFEIIKNDSSILPILKFSYDQLPSHMKQCFAYCALFPKDFVIKKQKLISLWMAQGFLQPNVGQCPKDVANKYFMDLLARSFFQDPIYDVHDNIIACKMHDFMHDLAKLVAGLECCMIILDTNYKIEERCRHVMLDYGRVDAQWRFPNELLKAKKIRTLLVQSPHIYDTRNDCHKIFFRYSSLRALDFSGAWLLKLSGTIGELKHLRYLNLSFNHSIKKLPNSVAKLKNLEILDLSYCGDLLELPRSITKMVNLKDLIINGCCGLNGMPRGLRALSNLQTLSLFVPPKRNNEHYKEYGALEELRGLNSLRGQLEVINLEQVDDAGRANYIEKMEFLGFLKLRWDDNHENGSETDSFDEVVLDSPKPHPKYDNHENGSGTDRFDEVLDSLKPHSTLKGIEIENFMGVKLSSWLSSVTNLTSIALSRCKRCQYIPPLDKLPSLKTLLLESLDDLEYISEEASNSFSSTSSRGFFPSLERLELGGCRKLKGWWRRDDDDDGAINEKLPSFACLCILEIKDCPNLTSMPLYPSIEEVTLDHTSGKALQRTMMLVNGLGPSTSSSFSAPLSKLKSLCLRSIDDLEYTSEEASNICSSTPSRTFFPSLKLLKLWGCSKLKGWWRRDDDDDGATNEKLPSFACLSILEIQDCPNLTSMPLYPSIEEVTLDRTSGKVLQPTMMLVNGVGPSTSSSFSAPLSNLKSLHLRSIHDLEYISEKAGNSCSSMSSGTVFPSLKQLSLEGCYKLRGWWRRDDGDDDDGATTPITELPSFACLSQLKISLCPDLTSMPLYPSLEELYLERTSSKPFQETMMMKNSTVGPSTSFSFSSPLFKLKSLTMREINDLECLPEDGLRNLSSLVDMEVVSCPRLTQLSQGIRFPTSLQKLTIRHCEELECLVNDEDNNDMKWHQFATTLEFLQVFDCKNFKALPKWMCNSTLGSLYLFGLPKLVSLPKRLQFLTPLSVLSIERCENLKVLPDSMCNLNSLLINGCPQLSENCGDNKGKDWPKIAHIPYIDIDGKCIQGRDQSDDLHTLKLSVLKKRTTCSTCFHRLIGVDVRPSIRQPLSFSWSLQSL